jgi:hypothetical protein
VPLPALLERAGIEAGACEIVLEGADRGIPSEPPVPPGPISYARSVPLSKALQREVLIAYQMNGSDLRVCPKTLVRIAEFSEHEANGGKAQECECLAIEILPIFGEPATAIEPSDRPLDDPAFWYDLEADGIVGSLDDFDMEMRKNFCQGICKFRSLIPTVGKEFLQEGK